MPPQVEASDALLSGNVPPRALIPGGPIGASEETHKPSVLIVEDDASFLEATAMFLQSHHYQPLRARTGLEAVREAATHRVDVAIIDLHLPDIGGLKIARELRRVSPSVGLIMISSDDSNETAERCSAAGAIAFLPKPLLPQELLSCIRASVAQLITPA